MPEASSSRYKGKVRVRVNGLLVRDEALLLVKIHSPAINEYVWMPPGGGLEFGETLEECLVREFREETGLQVKVGALRHINELVKPPYHAVEFFFDVTRESGELVLGNDPEHPTGDQILEDLQFIPFANFDNLSVAPEYVTSHFVQEQSTGKKEIIYSPEDR